MSTEKVRADLKWQNWQRFFYFAVTLAYISIGNNARLEDLIKAIAGVFQ